MPPNSDGIIYSYYRNIPTFKHKSGDRIIVNSKPETSETLAGKKPEGRIWLIKKK
jgi:hypothetical protein